MTESTATSIEDLLAIVLSSTPENVHINPLTRPYAQFFRLLSNTHGLVVALHWLAGRLINTAYGHPFSFEREAEFSLSASIDNKSLTTTSNPHSTPLLPSANLLRAVEDS